MKWNCPSTFLCKIVIKIYQVVKTSILFLMKSLDLMECNFSVNFCTPCSLSHLRLFEKPSESPSKNDPALSCPKDTTSTIQMQRGEVQPLCTVDAWAGRREYPGIHLEVGEILVDKQK